MLVIKTALTTVKNKIPSVSGLVKKTYYNSKRNNHNLDKYITTPEFNTLAADAFNARLAQANLQAKANFDNAISSLDSKIAANKTKKESIENELKKLKTLDLSILLVKVILKKIVHKIIQYFSQ